MIFEVINPSDPYTMVSDDAAAAAVACLFLGEGHYPLCDEKGEQVCPPVALLSALGGATVDLNETFRSLHGETFDDIVTKKRAKVVEALRSVLIGSKESRAEYEDAISHMTPEKAEEYRAKRHDRMRSSMNNIGRRAESLAKKLAAGIPKKKGE